MSMPHGHCASTPERAKRPISSSSRNLSPIKFFRKNREKMIAISSSSSTAPYSFQSPSSSRRPTRLRRSNQNKTITGGAGVNSTATTSTRAIASTSKSSSLVLAEDKRKEEKAGKMPPPTLTPIQMMIRRLYDKINRAHKASLKEHMKQLWKENRDSVDYLMKQHNRVQSAMTISSSDSGIVEAEDIFAATMQMASYNASTAERTEVLVVPETAEVLSSLGLEQDGREYQKIPMTTINHVSQIPPVLDWTAIPNNLHEDDGKFLTNIPFLGDEFIDKDAKFIDEMVTLYEGKVHEAKESTNFRKMDEEVFYTLIQAMMKIEAEEGPNVFKDVELVGVIEPKKLEDDAMEIAEEKSCSKSKIKMDECGDRLPKKTFPELAAQLFLPPPEGSGCSSPTKISASESPPPVLSPQNIRPESPLFMEAIKEESSNETVDAPDIEVKETEFIPPEEKMELVEAEVKAECSNVCQNKSTVNEGNESSSVSSNNNKPSDQIFSLLSTTFKGLGSPSEIRDRYEKAEKSRDIPTTTLPILPNGMEEQTPESYSIPNVEGQFAKYLPKEATMHAYRILFCRRCFIYDCKRHTGDDQVDVKYYKNQPVNSTPTSTSTSIASSTSSYNFLCKNPDCWQMNDVIPRNPDDILKEWGPGDRSLFSCFIESFPSNYCFIAYLMRNKSCADVKEYADLENVPKTETCPIGISSRKPKHRKPRLSKKSSGNSSSKRNITRRWINNVKKTEKTKDEGGIKSPGVKLPPRYMPCLHENGGECDSTCACRINKTSCEKFCTCALTCPYRFPGCKCLSTCDSKRCICFAAARECDPDLCLGCGANEDQLEKISCHNVNIQRKLHKHLLMGRSDISGWGIYIKNDAQKGEFIAEYRGELISHDESERRGHVYDKIQHTFLFELNDHFVVDATRKGNKARFVNSSKNPNCEVKRMLVNGDHRIGIYAKRFIEAGEELFYDYEDVLEKQQKAAEGARRNLQDIRE